jgi:hypothetical protein
MKSAASPNIPKINSPHTTSTKHRISAMNEAHWASHVLTNYVSHIHYRFVRFQIVYVKTGADIGNGEELLIV